MKVVIILAACAAIIANLLRTTVPEGLTEPWKYRLLVGDTVASKVPGKTDGRTKEE